MVVKRVRVVDVDKAIIEGIDDSKALRRAYTNFVDDVHDMWIWQWRASGPHDYETGAYEASIKKKMPKKGQHIKTFLKRGMPIGAVYSRAKNAHFIEYGTDVDNPDSKSPWGPDTETPEFAPMRKTQAWFS